MENKKATTHWAFKTPDLLTGLGTHCLYNSELLSCVFVVTSRVASSFEELHIEGLDVELSVFDTSVWVRGGYLQARRPAVLCALH